MNKASPGGVRRTIEREYLAKLGEFLHGGGEAALAEAYDLGRRAVLTHLSLLDLAMIHQGAVTSLLGANLEVPFSLAGQFFMETLSPYELTLRAYHDHARHLGLGHAAVQRNEELERARRQLRTILDATTALIYLRDVSRTFLFANRRFGEVVGVDHERLVGQPGDGAIDAGIDVVLRAGDDLALRGHTPHESAAGNPTPTPTSTATAYTAPITKARSFH
jgi:PAS domain-containing protein